MSRTRRNAERVRFKPKCHNVRSYGVPSRSLTARIRSCSIVRKVPSIRAGGVRTNRVHVGADRYATAVDASADLTCRHSGSAVLDLLPIYSGRQNLPFIVVPFRCAAVLLNSAQGKLGTGSSRRCRIKCVRQCECEWRKQPEPQHHGMCDD